MVVSLETCEQEGRCMQTLYFQQTMTFLSAEQKCMHFEKSNKLGTQCLYPSRDSNWASRIYASGKVNTVLGSRSTTIG